MRTAGAEAVAPQTHSVAWAVDPSRWEAVIFRLATSRPTSEAGVVYQVGHLSAPEIEAL